MLIKCISKSGKDLPDDCINPHSDKSSEFALKINKIYVVYAMTLYSGYVWYYICNEHYGYYPVWNPSPLFSVEDGQLSKSWIYTFSKGKDKNHMETTWAYPEWANDPYYYYDQLTDGEEDKVQIFKKYKKLMDLEFPNPSISEKAVVLDTEWLLCPICIDAWECNSKDGMVVCPKCEKMQHNPRYEKTLRLIT